MSLVTLNCLVQLKESLDMLCDIRKYPDSLLTIRKGFLEARVMILSLLNLYKKQEELKLLTSYQKNLMNSVT